MHVVTEYPDGIFSWVDLTSADTAAAKPFYEGLFGWTSLDIPINETEFYTMFQLNGHNVAGMGTIPEGWPSGMSVWNSYVNSQDIDAVAARVAEAGGQLIMPPMDVMDSGRMMMLAAPDGSVLGVWQAKNHIGAEIVNAPNSLVWNELQTRQTEEVQAFFTKVFGWDVQIDEGSGYAMFAQDGRVHAGMMQMDDSWGEMPNVWATYFLVEDVDSAVAKAQELGGSVAVPKMAAGEMGNFAVLADPAGGMFTVMEFHGEADPPPGA